jgi:hypothetical protein
MDHIEFINRRQPRYDGPWISGEDHWQQILQDYMLSHGREVTTAHSLRSKWSKAKTSMENLVILNERIAKGKVSFLNCGIQANDSLTILTGPRPVPMGLGPWAIGLETNNLMEE